MWTPTFHAIENGGTIKLSWRIPSVRWIPPWLGFLLMGSGWHTIAAPLGSVMGYKKTTNLYKHHVWGHLLFGLFGRCPNSNSIIDKPNLFTRSCDVATWGRVFFCISKYTTINIARVSHELSDLSPWNISWNIPLILVFQYIVLYHHLREKSW